MQQLLKLNKQKCVTDPVYFGETLLGFSIKHRPDQQKVMKERELRNCICAGRRWGKDVFVINERVIPEMWTRAGIKIGVYAPGWDEAKVFMEIFREAIDNAKAPLGESIVKNNMFEVVLSNKSQILCRVASKLSTGKRGRGFDMLVFTEAAFISDADVAVARATALGRNCEEWHTSQQNGWNHFKKTFDSNYYKSWAFDSADNPMVTKEELEKEKSLCTELEFRSLFKGGFVDEQGAVFHTELINKAINNDIQILEAAMPEERYYAGVDLGRKRDKSTIYIIREHFPHVDLVHWKEFNIHKDDPVFWDKVIQHIEFLCAQFKILTIKVDQTGLGDKPVMDLQRSIGEKNIPTCVEGVNFTYAVKNKWEGLINQLLLKFERYQIHMPFIMPLVTQLKSIRFNPKSRLFHAVGQSPDHVMALALAVSAVPYSNNLEYSKSNRPGYTDLGGFVFEEEKKIDGYIPKAGEYQLGDPPEEKPEEKDVQAA